MQSRRQLTDWAIRGKHSTRRIGAQPLYGITQGDSPPDAPVPDTCRTPTTSMPGTIETPVSVVETTKFRLLPSETEVGLTGRLRPGDSVDEGEGRAAEAGLGATPGKFNQPTSRQGRTRHQRKQGEQPCGCKLD